MMKIEELKEELSIELESMDIVVNTRIRENLTTSLVFHGTGGILPDHTEGQGITPYSNHKGGSFLPFPCRGVNDYRLEIVIWVFSPTSMTPSLSFVS